MNEFLSPPVRRPPSPCVSLCELDEAVGMCRGCGRTMAEIANWLKLDADAREAVWSALPARLEQLKANEEA